MTSSFTRKSLIFCTFFITCAGAVLLLASLTTNHWTESRAKRSKNPLESDGKIHFGLFHGRKELNVAYGWRTYDIDVIQTMKYEPEFLNYWLWLGIVVTICISLLSAVLSAVLAIVNTVANSSSCGTLTGLKSLVFSNGATCLFTFCAIAFSIAQYYMKIQYNVLSREDLNNGWTSENMAEFGYSFWFVVGATCASFLNIFLVAVASSQRARSDNVVPVLEEKANGAIMLY